MSKYIRTKNGIFERDKCKTTLWVMHIIKEADTIEELCDGIIVEEKDKPNKLFIMEISEFEEMDKKERLYQLKDYNFNAFIKSDKGLIYVAKMNDKGELELL